MTTSHKPKVPICLDCGSKATHVMITQFAGDHDFCEIHAKMHPHWGQDDNSYWFWKKL